MKRLLVLTFGDMKNITRDSMLLIAVIAPFLLAFAMRYGLPFIITVLVREISFDLSPYMGLIMSVIVLITPLMMGMLSGFLILDERDENILTFFSVTPITKSGYLFYRIAMPTFLSLLLSFFVFYFIGIVDMSLAKLAPVLVLCALESPMIALFLGAFASNKVEGLALTKALGILFLAPVAGFFIKSDWHYVVGIAPQYWISKALLAGAGGGGGYWFFITVGAAVHFLILVLLIRRFENTYV